MSGGFQLPTEISIFDSVGAVTGSSTGTSITSSGSANTKGAWTQLIASTTRDTDHLALAFTLNGGTSNTSFGIDIGVGAGGSESAVVTNFPIFLTPSQQVSGFVAVIPVKIPAGSRVSARCQSSGTTQSMGVSASVGSSSLASADFAQIAEAVGFSTSTTLGTAVDSGASANTKGSYAQLTAATSAAYRGFMLVLDTLNTTASVLNTKLLDIAFGAGGSEQILVPNLPLALSNVGGNVPQQLGPFWVPIPEATRIAARCQSSSNAADSRKVGVTLMGLR